MTKAELHEISCIVNVIIDDDCDEIRNAYKKIHGSLKGLKNHIRKECIEFWSNHDPYLNEEYIDLEWIKIGNKIVNLDDIWCFIRDGLKFDASRAA